MVQSQGSDEKRGTVFHFHANHHSAILPCYNTDVLRAWTKDFGVEQFRILKDEGFVFVLVYSAI